MQPPKKPLAVLVSGSRRFCNPSDLFDLLDDLEPTLIIVGDCPTGADAIARQWAECRGVRVDLHQADWKFFGRKAGPFRNRIMARLASRLHRSGHWKAICVFCWPEQGEASAGTVSCFRLALDCDLNFIELGQRPRGVKHPQEWILARPLPPLCNERRGDEPQRENIEASFHVERSAIEHSPLLESAS